MRWAGILLLFAASEASLGVPFCGAGPAAAPRPGSCEDSGKMSLPAFCGLGGGGASLPQSRAAVAAGRIGGLGLGGRGPFGRTCSAHAPPVGGASMRRRRRGAASISMMSDSDLDPMSRRDRIKATKRAGDSEEKPMLFVGNLPWVLDSWGLEKLFEPYGKIVAAKISFDHRTDRSRGYGFVIYQQWSSAKAALSAMQGREVGGRRIDVQPSGVAPRSDPVMDDLRTNPARFSAQSTRSDSTSQEKMAYELTVEAMDLMFWEKFNDPYYNVTADDWYPMIIDDQDDELDWTDYKMNWDYYDPLQKKVIFGVDQFEQMRENGPGGKKIDWDADWIADPIQILSDGSEYHVADPDRPVPENFDQIFEDGDELRMKQLMDWDGTMDLDALRLSNRASGQDRQRKPGDMNNRLNIVDPFGKRSVRRGLRDKASAQKGAIETMQEQQKVLKRAGARIDESDEDADLSPEERARMLKWKEQTNLMKTDQDGKGPGGRWNVVKKNQGSSPPAASNSAKSYSPPEDGYTLMPPGGIPDKPGAGGGPGGEGIKRAAGLGRQPPPTKTPAAKSGSPAGTTTLKGRAGSEPPPEDQDGPPAAKGSVGTTTITRRAGSEPPPAKKGPPAAKGSAAEGEPVVKRSRGRPRKDGTPAQPRAKKAAPAEGGQSSPPNKRGGAKKKDEDSEDSTEE